MRNWIRIGALWLALGMVHGLTGCVVTEATPGVGRTTFVLGQFDGTLPAIPQKIVQAARKVLEEQQILGLTFEWSALKGSVTGRTALDTKIEVIVSREDDSSSKISIRVGTFGDRQLSLDLYEKISSKVRP